MMNKKKLSSLQFACLVCFPILSLYSGIGAYNLTKITGVDSYLSILVAYVLGISLYLLFKIIFFYKEDLNILDKNKYLFGDTLGNIINIIMNLLILFIGVILLYNISNFAISQFLDQTPILIFMIMIGIILVYNVSKGILNIARVAVIFLILVFLLTLFGSVGLLPHFQSDYLKPFLEFGVGRAVHGGIEIALMNILPNFLLLIVPRNKIQNDQHLGRKMFLFYTFAFLLIFVVNILTMGTLGIYLVRLYQYPEYTVLQKISLFDFIDRIENFIYIKWILTSVICLSLVLYHVGKLFSKIKIEIRSTVLMIVMIVIALNIFKNNTYFYMISYSIFPYVCLGLLFIYLIIGVNVLVRKILEAK